MPTYPLSGDDLLLLEIDFSSYDGSCKDLYLSPTGELVECRRERYHEDDTHATRAGFKALKWPVEIPEDIED